MAAEASPSPSFLSTLPALTVPLANPALAKARVVVIGGSIGGLAAAACLRAAGFKDVKVMERSCIVQPGAGLGVDDVSAAILRGLGVAGEEGEVLRLMRWMEERHADGRVIQCQPFPYFASRYSTIRQALADALPDVITYGRQALSVERRADDTFLVHFKDAPPVECDLVIAADGPRSVVRRQLCPEEAPMRWAGYGAWRGTVLEEDLPLDVRDAFRADFPKLGNCMYSIHCQSPRQHAILYAIDHGIVNWLIYENLDRPAAEPGRTTSAASESDIKRLKSEARSQWGEVFGRVIAATPTPWLNDIYDLAEPLTSMTIDGVALLGDAAHAITPHMAKGSNLALHDAFVLASMAAEANDLTEMLRTYSNVRVPETARILLLSRHLGRIRNGLTDDTKDAPPKDAEVLERVFRSAGLPTATLPTGVFFEPVWDFEESRIPEAERSFYLDKEALPTQTCHGGRGFG